MRDCCLGGIGLPQVPELKNLGFTCTWIAAGEAEVKHITWPLKQKWRIEVLFQWRQMIISFHWRL